MTARLLEKACIICLCSVLANNFGEDITIVKEVSSKFWFYNYQKKYSSFFSYTYVAIWEKPRFLVFLMKETYVGT